MHDIEHPDITHVNRTGYTREQWEELFKNQKDEDEEHDKES